MSQQNRGERRYGKLELWRVRARVAKALLWFWRFREERLWNRVAGDLPQPAIVWRRFSGLRLLLELDRSTTHWRLWCRGESYVPEIRILEQLVRENWRVADVGANIGYVALALSRMVAPKGDVICFEPDPGNLRELRRNLEANPLPRVSIVPAAVGSSSGAVRFRSGLNGTIDERGEEEVRMVTLDEALSNRVDLVKIDVEGYEGEVLRGASAVIDRWHPVLFVEVHATLAAGWTHQRLIDWLRDRYAIVDGFERPTASGMAGKIANRYLATDDVQSADLSSIANECALGRRSQVFWVLAQNSR